MAELHLRHVLEEVSIVSGSQIILKSANNSTGALSPTRCANRHSEDSSDMFATSAMAQSEKEMRVCSSYACTQWKKVSSSLLLFSPDSSQKI